MKAKLEVEMPEGCYDCRFCMGTECGAVEGMPTIDLFGEEGLRPKWCPLILQGGTILSRIEWYLKGYNDAKKERGWIPVSERLPKGKEYELKIDGKTFYREVLVQTTSLNMHTAHYDTDAWFSDEGNRLDVLYLMPLPKLYRPE